jgi:hypothetical protein
VAGPVIAALFLVLWDLFAEEYVRGDPEAPPDVEAVSPPSIRSPSTIPDPGPDPAPVPGEWP